MTEEEMASARIAPKCVVENYIFSDVALFPAPGQTGKTTVTVFEAVHIVLGLDLYGLRVHTPGVVGFVTAEDGREILVARLRAIMDQMDLSEQDRAKVRAGIRIWDVTGSVCRLTELDARGNVQLTGLADEIVARFRDPAPVRRHGGGRRQIRGRVAAGEIQGPRWWGTP